MNMPIKRQTWTHPTYEELKSTMGDMLQTLKNGGSTTPNLQLEKLQTLQARLEFELSEQLSSTAHLTDEERQIYTEMISALLALNMELAQIAKTYMVTVKNDLNNLKKGMRTVSMYKSGLDIEKPILKVKS